MNCGLPRTAFHGSVWCVNCTISVFGAVCTIPSTSTKHPKYVFHSQTYYRHSLHRYTRTLHRHIYNLSHTHTVGCPTRTIHTTNRAHTDRQTEITVVSKHIILLYGIWDINCSVSNPNGCHLLFHTSFAIISEFSDLHFCCCCCCCGQCLAQWPFSPHTKHLSSLFLFVPLYPITQRCYCRRVFFLYYFSVFTR